MEVWMKHTGDRRVELGDGRRDCFGAKTKLGGSQRPELGAWKELEYDSTGGIRGRWRLQSVAKLEVNLGVLA
jgi:hypothetical protein